MVNEWVTDVKVTSRYKVGKTYRPCSLPPTDINTPPQLFEHNIMHGNHIQTMSDRLGFMEGNIFRLSG